MVKVLAFLFGLVLTVVIGLGVRVAVLKDLTDELGVNLQKVTGEKFKNIATPTLMPSMPKFQQLATNDKSNPKVNPEEWNFISNKEQICWIHKKTYRRVCENKS